MKITLLILVGLSLLGEHARAQVPAIRRLVSPNADNTDWIPVKEKTGNLNKFKQGTKKLGLTLRCSGLNWSDLNARGFQFVQNANGTPVANRLELPGTHESGPHALSIGVDAQQWTQAQCYHFGRNVAPVYGLIGDQYNEPPVSASDRAGYIDSRSNQYKWVYEGIRDKAATMTPRPILIGSYETKFDSFLAFQPGGGAWNPNRTELRNSLASGANARSGIWWFGTDMSRYVMPIYQVYPLGFNNDSLYQQAYGIQRLQKACEGWANPGYTLGAYLFVWPFVAGGGIGASGYPYEHPMTGGRLYQHTFAVLSFDTMVAMSLNTFVLTGSNGGIYVWEDFFTFSDADPNRVEVDFSSQYKPSDIWKPFNNAPQPTSSTRPTMPARPLGVFSAPIVAAEFYGEMIAAGGENFQFKRFKVGNGAYIEPGTGDTSILEAAQVRRGWCKASQNGNGFGIYYTNPRAPRGGETVTVDLGGGKTVTFDCYGSEPVAIAGNHPGGSITLTRSAAF